MDLSVINWLPISKDIDLNKEMVVLFKTEDGIIIPCPNHYTVTDRGEVMHEEHYITHIAYCCVTFKKIKEPIKYAYTEGVFYKESIKPLMEQLAFSKVDNIQPFVSYNYHNGRVKEDVKGCGIIYFLFNKYECVYIGMSRTGKREHKDKEWSHYYVLHIPYEYSEVIQDYEADLIKEYQPQYNKTHKK
jgi:hypothetical protein